MLENIGPVSCEEAAKAEDVCGDIQETPLLILVTTLHAAVLVQLKMCK